MERGKDLTSAERTAMVQDINGTLRFYRGAMHGTDNEGLTDIEFPSMRHASMWLEEFALWPVAANRDPIGSFLSTVVIQVTLYDYANRRGYMDGRPYLLV